MYNVFRAMRIFYIGLVADWFSLVKLLQFANFMISPEIKEIEDKKDFVEI